MGGTLVHAPCACLPSARALQAPQRSASPSPTCLCREEQAGGREQARVGGAEIPLQIKLAPVDCSGRREAQAARVEWPAGGAERVSAPLPLVALLDRQPQNARQAALWTGKAVAVGGCSWQAQHPGLATAAWAQLQRQAHLPPWPPLAAAAAARRLPPPCCAPGLACLGGRAGRGVVLRGNWHAAPRRQLTSKAAELAFGARGGMGIAATRATDARAGCSGSKGGAHMR